MLEAVAMAPIPIIIRNRDRRALIFTFTIIFLSTAVIKFCLDYRAIFKGKSHNCYRESRYSRKGAIQGSFANCNISVDLDLFNEEIIEYI